MNVKDVLEKLKQLADGQAYAISASYGTFYGSKRNGDDCGVELRATYFASEHNCETMTAETCEDLDVKLDLLIAGKTNLGTPPGSSAIDAVAALTPHPDDGETERTAFIERASK